MEKQIVHISGHAVQVYSLNTVVVGSGAAGLNAADRLYSLGQTDVAIVTEGKSMGTSRNTGSDKQTYYKMTLAGKEGDSVYETARTLFDGGCMHGDIALVEAALSVRCFNRLVDIGVPFPHNRWGEYVGYKTDHDPRSRATSAGPLTSRYMTEKLEEQVAQKNISVFDRCLVIGILTDRDGKNATGLLALNLDDPGDPDTRYMLFNCTNIIYAAGGPAGMYGASVFPESQTGASGIAFEAGVKGKNLTEWQFGIASVAFRWNLSGTYQQVLPRYVSTDAAGEGEREFLDGCFGDPCTMLDAVFLKGYQWPFDPRKVAGNGSSAVDLLVYNETVLKGRRVFLDYTKNPASASHKGELDFDLLGTECRGYLEKSGALFGTPVERLKHMNRPAYELFKCHGIDLVRDRLEVAVSAQHNNGGLYGGIWWESNIGHFFPVGEVNGSLGVHRPGGSALNAGQVGSLRAAQYIAGRCCEAPPDVDDFIDRCGRRIEHKIRLGETFAASKGNESTVHWIRESIGDRMDASGGILRSLDATRTAMNEAKRALETIASETKMASIEELAEAFRNYDLLLAQYVYLFAIVTYIEAGGKSRGSFIVADPEGEPPVEGFPDLFRYTLDGGAFSDRIQVVSWRDGECTCEWEPVRPIPEGDDWFESVWNDFMNGRIMR